MIVLSSTDSRAGRFLLKVDKQRELIALIKQGTQQQRPESPTVTTTWHASNSKVHKLYHHHHHHYHHHHHQHHHHHHHHLSLNRELRWCTTEDFATSFLHFSLFSTALWDLANSRPVHSLMLSAHLFLCLPCLLPPFTVLCQAWRTGNMTISLQFASLYRGQEVFVWSDCLLDLGTDFLDSNMVFVWDA